MTPIKKDGEPYNRINPKELKTLIEKSNPKIIDVREVHEYDTGHIKSSECLLILMIYLLINISL